MVLSHEEIDSANLSSLGALLAQIREEKGWSQAEAAFEINKAAEDLREAGEITEEFGAWSQSQYSKWELDRAEHTVSRLRAVCRAFGIDPVLCAIAIGLVQREEFLAAAGTVPVRGDNIWRTQIPRRTLNLLHLPADLEESEARYLARHLKNLRDWRTEELKLAGETAEPSRASAR